MNTYLIADTHFNHANIETYCRRPADFTEQIITNWRRIVQPRDILIHLGDVFIDKHEGWDAIWPLLPGRKILIRGNHDRKHSNAWWMEHGFDFSCDSMMFRNCWLTHEPAPRMPYRSQMAEGSLAFNLHGHLHTWDFVPDNGRVFVRGDWPKWRRLVSCEYFGYKPINIEKYLAHPDKYNAYPPEETQ